MLSPTEISNRQVQGLLIGCIFISVGLFVVVYIDFIRQVAKNNFVEFDVKTITAGDYTCEFDISDQFYRQFLDTFGANKPTGMTMIVHFRNWITKEMEDKLSAMPSLGFDTDVDRIKVANTTFAFDNAELIILLKQRGQAISDDNFDLMRQID